MHGLTVTPINPSVQMRRTGHETPSVRRVFQHFEQALRAQEIWRVQAQRCHDLLCDMIKSKQEYMLLAQLYDIR